MRLHRGQHAHAVHGQLVLGPACDALPTCASDRDARAAADGAVSAARVAPVDASRRCGRAAHVRGDRSGRAVRARDLGADSRAATIRVCGGARGARRAGPRGARGGPVSIVANLIALLVMPIVITGTINRVKARWAGRVGPPIFQLAFDLWRLVRKTPVYSNV